MHLSCFVFAHTAGANKSRNLIRVADNNKTQSIGSQNKGKGMQSWSEQPLVGEERCMMRLSPHRHGTKLHLIQLATKIQKLVAKLATRTHWVLYFLP